VKTASPTTYSTVGTVITYSYKVTNSGNVTLAGPFSISDNKLGTIACPTGLLSPGASVTCTATHAITAADLTAGSITNTATASGNGVTSNPSSATVTAVTSSATGCPATQGFWHKASHWPTVSGTADGVTWNVSAQTLTIGAQTYTQNQILQLLPSGSLHSGGVENDLSQFIAAALNVIAGAQHSLAIDAIIGTIASDLSGTNLFSPGPLNIPAQAATDLTNNGGALDAYNSAKGMGCTEGAGLKTGN
jgi:hypothetical protein